MYKRPASVTMNHSPQVIPFASRPHSSLSQSSLFTTYRTTIPTMQFSLLASVLVLASSVVASPIEKRAFFNRGAKLTWYAGNALSAPACGGPTPSDNDMVAAVSRSSQFNCGDELTFEYYGKQSKVRVVDICEGCDSKWFDLSKAAFSALEALEVGELINVDFWK